MKITTVKGTNDYLPEEVRLRDYLQNQILNTYQDAGFSAAEFQIQDSLFFCPDIS